MPKATESQPDPGGLQAAVDRYRDLAKYLITVFAGVGALLVAGTQLASIGKLSWNNTRDRVLAAGIGLALSVAAIACIIALALRVLRPVEMSLDEVVADSELLAYINGRPTMLGGADSVAALRETLDSPLITDDERDAWADVASDVIGAAAYRRMRSTFDSTWRPLLGAAVAGVLGITAFAWGANPPDSDTASPVVQPAPVLLTFTLTSEGRQTLSSVLGASCVAGPIRALSVGGQEGAPRVVTLPSGSCKAAQFVLDPGWGAPIATQKAPGG
jgi:hypothetical protein